jgi:ergothioneine biosynthesis protein EgtB
MMSSIGKMNAELLSLVELGLHHEQQHQELLLMDIKHLLSRNPLSPSYYNNERQDNAGKIDITHPNSVDRSASDDWLKCPSGLVQIGCEPGPFHFDNETPRHNYFLHPHKLAQRLVTNGEYLRFIKAGGYESPLQWLADGWAAVQEYKWKAPLYWRYEANRWLEFSMHGLRDLALSDPVSHISYYEADAYARWNGSRLPTEFEWEASANKAKEGGTPPSQMFDTLWQWTSSPYLPYPGFRAPVGAVGEYNGKFMVNQMTLRGSSSITPQGHSRPTYRNFFYPHQRWAYTGIRLAKDD